MSITIIVYPKASWVGLQSAVLANTTTASDCQTLSGQIPYQTEERIDGHGGKDFQKKRRF